MLVESVLGRARATVVPVAVAHHHLNDLLKHLLMLFGQDVDLEEVERRRRRLLLLRAAALLLLLRQL